MTQRIAYRPQVSQQDCHAFEQRLSECRGSWKITCSFIHADDPRVLRLHWIIPGKQWCDVPGYLTFLDSYQHRVLLRCFVRQSLKSVWRFDELRQQMGLHVSPDALNAALSFCEMQEFLFRNGKMWQPGPCIKPIINFGATFEWLVTENLQRFSQSLARRSVTLNVVKSVNIRQFFRLMGGNQREWEESP